MKGLLGMLSLCVFAAHAQEQRLRPILDRLSEEAEVFRQLAPKVLSQEVLVQRALKIPGRGFPIRIGRTDEPDPEYRVREIVSEYGFSAFRNSPAAMHEFRQVVTVDGRRILSQEKARRTLTAGLVSEDDRLRKNMLEQFEKHGLTGAAADFGQVILLFSRRRLPDYEFALAGEERLGADRVHVVNFNQRAGQGSVLIFERSKAIYRPLAGEIWARQDDGLPVRIVLRTERPGPKGVTIRDHATVDYVRSPHGVMVPAAIVHRQYAGTDLIVENVFQYSAFRLFVVDAEIKFE